MHGVGCSLAHGSSLFSPSTHSRALTDEVLVSRLQGFDALLVDYLHPRKWPILGPIMTWVLRAATVGVLIGVYQFETNDIGALPLPSSGHLPIFSQADFPHTRAGLTELIKKAWKGEKKVLE